MAYIITETCVDLKDKSCVDVCPVDCIIDGGAEDRMLYINPDECIDCGACVDPCPVAAIYPEDEVPAGTEEIHRLEFRLLQDRRRQGSGAL